MNEKFYDLKKEKQDKMINGAMEIFAKNGYKHASTDDMVKVCGVSKGLWFHYFENKKGLYNFVVGYAIKYAIMEYENMHVDRVSIFELLKCFERTKMILMEKYPYLPLLIITVLEEQDSDALSIIQDSINAYKECLVGLMGRADFGLLRESPYLSKLSFMTDTTFRRILKACYNEPVFRREYYLEECYGYIDMAESLLNQAFL